MFADSRPPVYKQKVTIKLPIQNIAWFCGNQWYSGDLPLLQRSKNRNNSHKTKGFAIQVCL